MLDRQRHLRVLTLVPTAALIAAMSGTAQAQSADAQGDQATPPAVLTPVDQTGRDARQPQQLEDIVVTAERRTESLQDVPISATVLNAADIERKGVNDVADLQQVAPSVAINTYNRSTFINIRGVGIAQSAPTSNPGVAFYIDGMLIPHEQFIGQSFYDIQSIEVLRGPQGTLTGQNSTGGAVYVRTRAPDFDSVSAYVDATYGNYDHFKMMGAINVPVSDQFAIRAAGVHDEQNSFTKNIGSSASTPGNNDLYAGRLSFAFRSPSEVLRGAVHIDYFDQHSDNNAVKNRNDTVTNDPFVIEEDARSFQNQHGGKLSGEVKIALTPKVDLRTLVGYQNLHTIDQTDGDRTSTALPRSLGGTGRVSRVSTDIDTFLSEINLLSTGKGPFNWVVGAFYLDETVAVLSRRDQHHTDDFYASDSTFQTSAANSTKSAFGQINWFVATPIELVAGARYSDDRQVYNRIIPAGPTPPGVSRIGVEHSTQWTGKLGINYHIGDDMLYVTASQGYKQGGVNLTLGTPNFGPEKNRVYEAGFKTQWLSNRLRVNGDVFYSQYRDIQLASLLGGLPITQNAARGKAYGAELEVTGQFGGLLFNAGGGYLHARFDGDSCITDTNSPGTDPGCGTYLRLVPDGRVLPFSPKWTINAGVQYDILIGSESSLTPRVQWSHLSAQYATPFLSVNTLVPSHDVFDAKLTYAINDRYSIEGFVNNFTDKVYIASQIQNSSSADGGIIYGAPRTYGVRVIAKF
jgi:iron complex outermembrane receptor protein